MTKQISQLVDFSSGRGEWEGNMPFIAYAKEWHIWSLIIIINSLELMKIIINNYTSIEPPPGASTKLGRSSGRDVVAARSLPPVDASVPLVAGTQPHYRPRTWASRYALRAWTSDPFNHVTRQLLSYLSHQETTFSRPSRSYRCIRAS